MSRLERGKAGMVGALLPLLFFVKSLTGFGDSRTEPARTYVHVYMSTYIPPPHMDQNIHKRTKKRDGWCRTDRF